MQLDLGALVQIVLGWEKTRWPNELNETSAHRIKQTLSNYLITIVLYFLAMIIPSFQILRSTFPYTNVHQKI